MKNHSKKTSRQWPRPLIIAAVVFLGAAVASAALVWRLEQYRYQEDRTRLFNEARDHAVALELHLARVFSATYALGGLVRQGNGKVRNFKGVASEMLPYYPGVAALELVPGGIVRNIVPRHGNEGAMGYDVFEDPGQKREAFLARDTGKLTLAGPLDLRQGGSGVVGRLPVFLDDGKGGQHFWGFISVVIRFPEALVPAQLSELVQRDFAYKLWRIHPDSKQKQIIAASSSAPLKDPVEKSIEVPNGTWMLSVAPVSGWSNPLGLSLRGAIGLLFSLLLAWLAKLLVESKTHEAGLEALVAERTAEIRESEERLRLLADNLPDSYVYQYVNENGRSQFIQLSAGVEKLHGIRRQDALRDAAVLHQQVDPEQLSAVLAAEEVSRSNMTDFLMTVRLRRSDGEYRWVQLRSRPRLRGVGQVVWDGVATDITERKQIEEALRTERDFSNAILNSLPNVVYMFDEHLTFLRWNETCEHVSGYTGEEMSRLSPLDFFAGDEKNLVAAIIKKAFEQGAAEVEANLIAKDGTSKPYYFTGVATRIGGEVCLLGVGIDITERRRAEKALEEARLMTLRHNSFLEAVMDSLPVGVAIIDTEGTILRKNHTFEEVWAGCRPGTSASAHPRVWWIETGQPVRPDELASARALLQDEKVEAQLLRIEKRDGTPAYVHNNAAPFHDPDGRIAGCAVAVMDITEQIEMKDSLRMAKDAAEAANSAKSEFLANMSHELRTPMSGILGMLELALQEDISPVTRQHLETTVHSARSLLRILNDILDMTNIVAGRLSIEQKPFLLLQCLNEAVEIISFEARQKGLVITLSVAEEVPDAVIGDQVRLRQVLLNLIGNAVKFTRKGKVEVLVTAGVTTPEGKREVTFAVRDTGIGIPEEKKGLIFRAFSQVDTSHSRIFGGMGLGLAISNEIVGLLGGTISFESREGAGSTFTFTIPLAEAGETGGLSVAEPEPIQTPTSAETPPHILLAEDDPTIRDFLALMFKRSNYKLTAAEDGLEAVELWEKEHYDLVLMDIQMPRLNGYEAARAIREKEQERGGHTPIVAVTAHAFNEDRERCLAAGMDAYIAKPINFKKSLELIGQIIKQKAGNV